MNVHSILSFPHNYTANILPQLPDHHQDGEKILYYPGASKSGGDAGLIVTVDPKTGHPWTGVFTFGFPEDEYSEANGIYSCPNPLSICVVSDGDAYIVDTQAPENWTVVQCTPVLAVTPLTEHGLLLVIDFSTICAWGRAGQSWCANVAHDGIKIEGVRESCVYGRALGPVPGKENVYFEVDLQTGKVAGGNCI
jgi:hypothetical protein